MKKFVVYFSVSLLMLFVLLPMYWMVVSAVKGPVGLYISPPLLFPRGIDLSFFHELLTRTLFTTYFLNSVLVAIGTMIIGGTIGTLGAYSLTRFRYRLRESLGLTALITYLFPPIMLSIPLFTIFTQLHIANTHFGLVLAQSTFAVPFAIWVLRDFFASIPVELEESARIDGASQLYAFARITLPLAGPGIVSIMIYTLILSWNEYVYALILITTENLKTLPPGVAAFFLTTEPNWGLMLASSVLITLPVTSFFAIVQKYIVRGLAVGAIKG